MGVAELLILLGMGFIVFAVARLLNIKQSPEAANLDRILHAVEGLHREVERAVDMMNKRFRLDLKDRRRGVSEGWKGRR